ncbi:MarR family transcriptional regulator [Salinibacterium sp. G-O1]|uniref:MarR family winged helix-turn-helix transcriptional regulator n=1 Tax=Salinibacterium sp. G-O1 TaxID=3046208 RepID=UPI0024BB9E00|nr:MarR family transcriptional regulator [Salinibacterium sp. G-O1]MDJ0335676.1 MarR family transcriptional regulator [Salinibacterium sp. G-O1]
MTTAEEGVAGRTKVHRATELLRELITANEAFTEHMGRQLSVNPTDLSAMTHLISGGPLGPTELSRRLQLSTAAVTTVVDRLESAGHVHRAQHPTDRRSVVIVPSPASVQQAMGVLIPMITGIDNVISEFPEDQRDVINAYLERVVDVYQSQVP